MRNVLLIDPGYLINTDPTYKEFSLGLITIAGYIKHTNKNLCNIEYFMPELSELVDFDKKMSIIKNSIIDIKPDIIGCTTRCDTYPFALEFMEAIKESLPNIHIIMGGPQATHTDVLTMTRFSAIDYIIRGEGEETFYELLTHIIDNNENISNIKGLTYRGKDGKIFRTDDREMMEEIRLYPDYKSIWLKDKHININRIEAGRGCPYNCVFCSLCKMWNRRYRLINVNELIQTMRYINSINQSTYFVLEHDNLLAGKSKAEKFLSELILLNNEFQWSCSSRIDNIYNIDVSLIKKSGCSSVYFGIETGSEKMQKIYDKNINLSLVYPTLNKLNAEGINFTVSFVCGHPDEKVEDILNTIYLSVKCNTLACCNGVQIHKMAPLAGSRILEQYKAQIFLDEDNISDQSYMSFFSRYKDMILENPQIFSSFYSLPIEPEIKNILDMIFAKGVDIINCFPRTIFYAVNAKLCTTLDIVHSFVNMSSFLNIVSSLIKKDTTGVLLQMFEYEMILYECSQAKRCKTCDYKKSGDISYNKSQRIIETNTAVLEFQAENFSLESFNESNKCFARIWKDFRSLSVKSTPITPFQKIKMSLCNNREFVDSLNDNDLEQFIREGFLVERI